MAYRSEVWLRIAGNIFVIFIQVSIWKALLGVGASSGVTLEEMITYSIVTTASMTILMTNVFQPVSEKLKTGGISVDLQKPISYPLQLFADQTGLALFNTLFNVIPSIIIAAIIFGIQLPEMSDLFPFVVSLLIAIVISFLLGYLIALISFWMLTTFALSWTLNALITVFSGSFVPLWFFSSFWLNIANLLPFQYLGFIPTSMYLGRIEDDLAVLALGCFWVLLLLAINMVLWKFAVKRLVVQGG
ncbi:hypothetical protein G4V62_17975 [Bacillaceae bacterium SIJ1]|uniref:ABC transporter permease n=1 Tax=Litoribacterium kuwaitense TaxID=1398745 RepID=UPI0013ECCB1D|nr:ABC-2 family transporter protein [Litoribacterium kuwaitense]NGP46739.1 hypothetical protein [Litoribacterium kuwaitense]